MAQHDPIYKIALDFREGLLSGMASNWMCRAVCLPLQGYLSCLGYETTLVECIVDVDPEAELHHTCLRLSDGRILDPTADQFTTPTGEAMPKVYLGELPAWYLIDEAGTQWANSTAVVIAG